MRAPPARAIEVAIEAANRGPCAKSKRGAVLFHAPTEGVLELSARFNGPPPGWSCDGSADCRVHCGRTCMHAEARCLAAATRYGITSHGDPHDDMLYHANNFDLVHVKTYNGSLIAGGTPSCLECSKQILEFGARGMWLYLLPEHDLTGHDLAQVVGTWKRYTAREFHYETLQNSGLPFAADRGGRSPG